MLLPVFGAMPILQLNNRAYAGVYYLYNNF
jgi:hypothetical protein